MQALEQLMYLKRLRKLTDVNFKFNPVSDGASAIQYYKKVAENVPNLEILDDDIVTDNKEEFFESK